MTSQYGCAYYDTIHISFRHKPVVDFFIDEEECRGYNLNIVFTGKVLGSAHFSWFSSDTYFMQELILLKLRFHWDMDSVTGK
jgi:hypothetical protein